MSYLLELIKGILIAFGIILGFLIFILWLSGKINSDDEYQAEDLIIPFQKYLKTISESEQYEQIREIENVIFDLKNGDIKSAIKFKIKKDFSISIKNDDGTSFKFTLDYTIIKKLNDEKK